MRIKMNIQAALFTLVAVGAVALAINPIRQVYWFDDPRIWAFLGGFELCIAIRCWELVYRQLWPKGSQDDKEWSAH